MDSVAFFAREVEQRPVVSGEGWDVIGSWLLVGKIIHGNGHSSWFHLSFMIHLSVLDQHLSSTFIINHQLSIINHPSSFIIYHSLHHCPDQSSNSDAISFSQKKKLPWHPTNGRLQGVFCTKSVRRFCRCMGCRCTYL